MENITAHWRYSPKCNLNCDFCFALPDPAENGDIDEKKIVDEILEAGFSHLVFTGGEPTIRKKELLEIIPYAHKKGLKLGIDTNGYHLDDELIRTVKENNVTLGLPLYSTNSEIHDNLVGSKGHHQSVVSLLRKVKENGIKTKINTMVSKKNKDDLLGIGEIIQNNSIDYWNIIRFKAYRKALSKKGDYDITEDEFLDVVNNIKQKYPSIKIVGHTKNEDRQEYFFIMADSRVVQPTKNGEERYIGDLKKESAKELIKRFDVDSNSKRTLIERVKNEGLIQ